jgi:hypothetical protein
MDSFRPPALTAFVRAFAIDLNYRCYGRGEKHREKRKAAAGHDGGTDVSSGSGFHRGLARIRHARIGICRRTARAPDLRSIACASALIGVAVLLFWTQPAVAATCTDELQQLAAQWNAMSFPTPVLAQKCTWRWKWATDDRGGNLFTGRSADRGGL